MYMNVVTSVSLAITAATLLLACQATDSTVGSDAAIDLTEKILINRSTDCSDYVNHYDADVEDISNHHHFELDVVITEEGDHCLLESNNIPNHDFNDYSADFATDPAEVTQRFRITKAPQLAEQATALAHNFYNGVMLNGVPIDILSAGCYRPEDAQADADGNVHIGCNSQDDWLMDPLGTSHKFGADAHNAHTQPDGSYHYHGNPMALFDDEPESEGSPVICFATDGFPFFGSYFYDVEPGTVRKAISGYELKTGSRPTGVDSPGGIYDGTYVDDYEFTGAGDLDACNGMTVDGQYGYYVTDVYPWIIACISGTPDSSFYK